jgi:hypothetical protein
MSDRTKSFDCVQNMRHARNTISAEIEGMNYYEIVQWLRSHRYADPVLQRLAEKAAQQAEATDLPSAGR